MSSYDDLPEQETLRRRLRAAMLLCDVGLQELAGRIDPTEKLSARTLRKLTNAESDIRMRALRPIAEALDVPVEWFTTPGQVWAPFEGSPAEFERRLVRLESELAEVARRLPAEALSEEAESVPRRRSAQHAPRGGRRSTGR